MLSLSHIINLSLTFSGISSSFYYNFSKSVEEINYSKNRFESEVNIS